jgi:hypothetical protein
LYATIFTQKVHHFEIIGIFTKTKKNLVGTVQNECFLKFRTKNLEFVVVVALWIFPFSLCCIWDDFRISRKFSELWWDKSLKFWPEVENITNLKKIYNKNLKKLFHDTYVMHQSDIRCRGTLLVKKRLQNNVFFVIFQMNIFEKSIKFASVI